MRIKTQCAATKQAATKFSPPTSEAGETHGQGCSAESGPSGWRNADIAAIGRTEGRPAVLHERIGTWTRTMVPHCKAKPWTAATIAPLDCGSTEPEPGQQMPQPCKTKASPNCVGRGACELGRGLRD